MDFQDIRIKCVTCGREFLFTAKEQEFFFSKGFKEPRHCRECRQKRKRERERAIAQATGQEYKPGKQMFRVICANCQRETFVPFKPITGKPVLCKDCFIAHRYGGLTLSTAIPEATPQTSSAAAQKAEEQTSQIAAAEPGKLEPEAEKAVQTEKNKTTEKPDSAGIGASQESEARGRNSNSDDRAKSPPEPEPSEGAQQPAPQQMADHSGNEAKERITPEND